MDLETVAIRGALCPSNHAGRDAHTTRTHSTHNHAHHTSAIRLSSSMPHAPPPRVGPTCSHNFNRNWTTQFIPPWRRSKSEPPFANPMPFSSTDGPPRCRFFRRSEPGPQYFWQMRENEERRERRRQERRRLRAESEQARADQEEQRQRRRGERRLELELSRVPLQDLREGDSL